MAELKKISDLRGPKGDKGEDGKEGPVNPAIYIGPDEPNPDVYTIWIDTRGLESG